MLLIPTGHGLYDVQWKNAARFCSMRTARNLLLCCCGLRGIIGVPIACRTRTLHSTVVHVGMTFRSKMPAILAVQ